MIVFLGAIDDEINLLRDSFDQKKIKLPVSGIFFDVIVRSCGIGKLESAISLYEIIAEYSEVEEVVFLGSAGAYVNKGVSCISSNHFTQIDLSVKEGRSKKPDLMSSEITSRAGPLGLYLSEKLELSPGTVNTTDSITLVSTELFPANTYENLEAYGLAYVANKLSIPFSCIMPVTNTVSPSGSDEWRRNFRIMSENLQKNILLLLDCS